MHLRIEKRDIFPEKLKNLFVIPTYKRCDEPSFTNNRPISVLYTLSYF